MIMGLRQLVIKMDDEKLVKIGPRTAARAARSTVNIELP
jgi:hypothetical protein